MQYVKAGRLRARFAGYIKAETALMQAVRESGASNK